MATPEAFLGLDRREQSQVYRALAPRLGRSPVVLEKDVWVCWVLQALFTMPGRLPMAFKGGTSLSKVFGAIARFSEDVDITLDYRALDASFDPFAGAASRTRLKRYSEELKALVRHHTQDVVLPHFQRSLANEFDASSFQLELSSDGERLRVRYPTALASPGDYVDSSILIEFGGRNVIDPNAEHGVEPDIAPYLAELALPRASVCVLSPARTFWEKATLIHVECQRTELRFNSERLSRHWYDLAMLAGLAVGKAALADHALLEDVVRHKKVFYNAAYANYDACLAGQFRLVPDAAALAQLREDFKRMILAGMFSGEPPAFDAIVERLRALEQAINRLNVSRVSRT